MPFKALNVKNQFLGTIRNIIEGPVVSEIEVNTYTGFIVTSVITTSSVKELGLHLGQEVLAAVKATDVSIAI